MTDTETVYVRRRSGNGGGSSKPRVHTDEDCYLLQQAGDYREDTRDEVFDDYNDCERCNGNRDAGGVPEGTAPAETQQLLSDTSPEEAGLSPLQGGDA